MSSQETPQDPSQQLVRYVGEEIAPEVGRFMGTVAGSPAFEVGELVAEHVRAWRFKREIKHVTKAMKQLEDAGMDPHAVPMRTLAPLIDGGSLEDDEPMVDRWASLLANAAGGNQNVPPSFPYVLRELEPAQARLLDVIYDLMMQLAVEFRPAFGLRRQALDDKGFALTEQEFTYHADNLVRLRLVRPLGGGAHEDEFKVIGLTEFGRAFVRACRPPSQPDPPIRWRDRETLQKEINERDRREAAERAAASSPQDAPEAT
jgi:hypothetical protein